MAMSSRNVTSGLRGDDGGGVVPKVVHPGSLEAQCRAGVGPGVREVLPAQREAARSGEDARVWCSAHVVAQMVFEGTEHELWRGELHRSRECRPIRA